HGRAQHLADLDSGEPDAAARAVHQQHLAGFKPAAVDQRVIGGAVAGQERRAFGIIEGRRQFYELRRRGNGFIGIGAVPHLDDHAITDRDAFGRVDLDDIAGGFHARRERQRRLELILARRHQNVGEVQPGGADSDTHLTRRQRLGVKRFQAQALGRPKLAADDGLRHQAARAFRRSSASRISSIRSLPKYMSVLSTKIVGEPKPPRAITSSVLALSWSLIACWPIPSKNLTWSTPAFLQTSVSTESCEMSLSPPQ